MPPSVPNSVVASVSAWRWASPSVNPASVAGGVATGDGIGRAVAVVVALLADEQAVIAPAGNSSRTNTTMRSDISVSFGAYSPDVAGRSTERGSACGSV